MISRRDWWLGIGAIVAALLLLAWLALPSHRLNTAIIESIQPDREHDTKALQDAAQGQVGIFKSAINLYKFHTGRYPNVLNSLLVRPGFLAGWAGPYLNGGIVPLDPWDHEYKLDVPGRHNTGSFDVWSAGPDGLDGTSDDIGNWPD